MSAFLPYLVAALIVGVLFVAYVGLGYALSQKKRYFTAPKEGTAEFVMTGNTVTKMITVWRNHRGDKDFNIEDEPYTGSILHYLNPLNWLEVFGIYWVGLPILGRKVYEYPFHWVEEKVLDDGKIVPHARHAALGGPKSEGLTHLVKLNDTNYFVIVDDVKTLGKIPLKYIILLTVRITNPYKALFKGDDWLKRTSGAVADMTVRYSGLTSYEDILAHQAIEIAFRKDSTTALRVTDTLEGFIRMLGDGKPDADSVDLELEYGVKIIAAKIHSIDFADDNAAAMYRDATTRKYVAEQTKSAAIAEAEGAAAAAKIRAEGDAAATRTRADAEQYRIETSYTPIAGKSKDKRMKIRQLEAIENAGAKGGTTIVVPNAALGLAAGVKKLLG
jgi:regulator of protease activity HflC (stomatin/prohibitin superfamily)